MKFISEKTNKTYATAEECLAAEKEYDEAIARKKAEEEKALIERKKKETEQKLRTEKLNAERKTRAAEVEKAYQAIIDANKNYHDLLNEFVKDYGSFHMTVHTGDLNPFDSFSRLFDSLF